MENVPRLVRSLGGSAAVIALQELPQANDATLVQLQCAAPGRMVVVSGRAAVMIGQQYCPTELERHSRGRLSVIVASLQVAADERMVVAAVYWAPYTGATAEEEDAEFFAQLLQRVDAVIGDLNARHPPWDTKPDNRGRWLKTTLLSSVAFTVHPRSPGVSFCHRSMDAVSCPDLFLMRDEWLDGIPVAEWKSVALTGSDHFPIKVDVHLVGDVPRRIPRTMREVVCRHKCNWPRFGAKVTSQMRITEDHLVFRIRSPPRFPTMPLVDAFSQWIRECFWPGEKELPRGKVYTVNVKARPLSVHRPWEHVKPRDTPAPLYVEGGDGRWQWVSAPETKARHVAKAFKELTQFTKEAYRELGFSVVEQQEPRQLPEELRHLQLAVDRAGLDVQPFEVWAVIRDMGAGKAPGFDGVLPEYLHAIADDVTAQRALTVLFNQCLDSGTVPASWKDIIHVPVKKAGKAGTRPRDYRPIGLTSVMSRLFEKLLIKRIQPFVDPQLHRSQYGFRYDVGCEEALAALYDYVRRGIDMVSKEVGVRNVSKNGVSKGSESSHHIVVALKIDFKNAFGSFPHRLALKEMRRLGVPLRILRVLDSLMTDRRARVVIEDAISEWYEILSGFTQGSMGGPAGFISLMDPLLWKLANIMGVFTQAFADDAILAAVGAYGGTVVDKIKRAVGLLKPAIKVLESWADEVGISLADKTSLHVFGRRLNPAGNAVKEADIAVTVGGHLIKLRIGDMKYLGVHFDDALNFTGHAAGVATSLQCTALTLKHTALPPLKRRQIGSGLGVTVIRYGLATWGNDIPANTHNELCGAYAELARIVCGIPRRTARVDALLEAGFRSFKMLRKEALVKAVLKAKVLPARHPARLLVNTLVPRLYDDFRVKIGSENRSPLRGGSSEYLGGGYVGIGYECPWPSFHTAAPGGLSKQRATEEELGAANARRLEEAMANLASRTDGLDRYNNVVVLATDGSVIREEGCVQTGCAGVLCADGDEAGIPLFLFDCGVYACSYRTEVVAMCELLKTLLCYRVLEKPELQQRYARYLIVVDSQGLLAALQRGPIACRGAKELVCWSLMCELMERRVVLEFAFVFSHVGTAPNEQADSWAERAGQGQYDGRTIKEQPVWIVDEARHHLPPTWIPDEPATVRHGVAVSSDRVSWTLSDHRAKYAGKQKNELLSAKTLAAVSFHHQKLFHQFRCGHAYLVGPLVPGQQEGAACPDCGEPDSVEHFTACSSHKEALGDIRLEHLFDSERAPDAIARIFEIWRHRRRQRATFVPRDALQGSGVVASPSCSDQ